MLNYNNNSLNYYCANRVAYLSLKKGNGLMLLYYCAISIWIFAAVLKIENLGHVPTGKTFDWLVLSGFVLGWKNIFPKEKYLPGPVK